MSLNILIKKSLKNNPPALNGRYLFLIEEQGDLGLSKFIWNCCFDKEKNIISDNGKYYNSDYWYEPIEISLESEEILPLEQRDKTGSGYISVYVNRIFKALEVAENKLIKLKTMIRTLK